MSLAKTYTPSPTSDTSRDRVIVEPSPRRVRPFFNHEAIADSSRVRLMHEDGTLPVYYFPMEDVRMDLLEPSDRTTYCERKGEARYWHLRVGDRVAENAVWGYPDPIEGCPDISGLVAFYWNKMDHWYEEDQEVFVHPRDPYHRVDVVEASRHVVVEIDGTAVAESRRPRLLYETGLPTRYYLPKMDVRMELFRPTDSSTRCPYKGEASYWTAEIDGTEHPDILWGYEAPIPEMPRIAGMVAFFNEKVDIILDGERLERPTDTPWS